MLTLSRSRRLIASLPFQQTRSLRSVPREIPPYIERWNPTLHRPPLAKENSLRDAAPADALPTEERIKLRDANHISIPIACSIPPTNHSKRPKNHSERIAKHIPKRVDAVENLGRLLRLAHKKDVRPELSTQLLDAYLAARDLYPDLPDRIPMRAWDVLWTALHVDHYPRTDYLQVLEDLELFCTRTTVGQRVRYLEELFLGGDEEKALEAWENDRSQDIGEWRHDYKPEHLEIGAKLHALAGNPDRARQVMEELFDLYPDWNPSVMTLVFRAHTSSGIEENYDVAKDIYVKIRERMGTDLTIETYDIFFIGFLEARCLHHAKQLFRDMCKDGHLASSTDADDVHEVLRRLHLLYRLGTDISKMTSIALDAISALPPSYHSRIYGHWLQCAVIENAPEAAAQIIDSMIHRGCEPETFHFNELLNALFRTEEPSKLLQAENIGWRMVERASLESVAREHPGATTLRRDQRPKYSRFIKNESPYRTILEGDVPTMVPCASITTFAVMMEHHGKDGQWEHVDYLARQLKNAGLDPNTAVMNIILDKECQQGQYSEAWGIYKSLTDHPDVHDLYPDGRTIRQLWKILRFALGDDTYWSNNEFDLPTPRALLAETVRWWELCRHRPDAERFHQGLSGEGHAIVGLMMHCFSYARDLPGCLVALHILRKNFDIFPNDDASDILKRHIAWVDMRYESEAERTQFGRSGIYERNLDNAEALFQRLLEQKVSHLHITGRNGSDLSEEEIGDMGLSLLSELVRAAMKEKHPLTSVEALIDRAKDEVGVPDMSTGELI